MFGWLVLAMFAFVTGWLAIMLIRERSYRNSMFASKHRAKAGGKRPRLNPDSFHNRGTF